MKRRWFTIAGTASLALCLGVAVMWVLSYRWRFDAAVFSPHARVYHACFYRGGFYFWVDRAMSTRWAFVRYTLPARPHPALDSQSFEFLGIGHTYTRSYRLIRVPDWLIDVILGAAAFLLLRKRHPPSPSVCIQCGYDLRATPGRCPECGTAVAA